MKSQTENILAYLRAGYSITPMQALTFFGCFRLASRIFDIRKAGFNIEMKLVGKDKRFAEYSLAE